MKYIAITPNILKAIESAAKAAGTNVRLADKAGIAPSTIGCYLLGKRDNIKESIFVKLYPFLKPYLDEDELNASGAFDFSKTAVDMAVFYDTLAEDDKNKMKMAQRDILMEIYNESKRKK